MNIKLDKIILKIQYIRIFDLHPSKLIKTKKPIHWDHLIETKTKTKMTSDDKTLRLTEMLNRSASFA